MEGYECEEIFIVFDVQYFILGSIEAGYSPIGFVCGSRSAGRISCLKGETDQESAFLSYSYT